MYMKNLLNNQKYHLIIFLILECVCILLLLGRLAKTGSAIGGDAVYYYSNLRSIVIDRDLDFQNEYEYFHNQTSKFTGNRKIPQIPEKNPITQKLPTKYPIGNAILLTPFFLIAHAIVSLLYVLKFNIFPDGYNLIYQAISALASQLYAFFGILLIYYLGKKFFTPKIAFLAVLGIWLATPLIYYMTMEPLTSQPVSFFCVSFFIYFWLITREDRKLYQWIILGLFGGLMSIVRYQDSFFILLPLIDNLRKFLNFKFIFLLFALPIIGIQLLVNNYLYGFPLSSGYGLSGFPYLTSPKILYSLLSLERGLFVWSPILIFSLIGWRSFVRKFKLVGSLLIFSFLIQLYIVSSWQDPTQGDSFGNRILLNSNLIFALGIMQYLKDTQTYQKINMIIFILLITANLLLAGLFIFRIIGQPY